MSVGKTGGRLMKTPGYQTHSLTLDFQGPVSWKVDSLWGKIKGEYSVVYPCNLAAWASTCWFWRLYRALTSLDKGSL